jgi:hypothetical protein
VFSPVDDLRSDRHHPSGQAASHARSPEMMTSLSSVYNTLPDLETHTASPLVRSRAPACALLLEHGGGERALWIECSRVTSLVAPVWTRGSAGVQRGVQCKPRPLPASLWWCTNRRRGWSRTWYRTKKAMPRNALCAQRSAGAADAPHAGGWVCTGPPLLALRDPPQRRPRAIVPFDSGMRVRPDAPGLDRG